MGWYSGNSNNLDQSIFRGYELKQKKTKQVYSGNESLSHAWASGNVEIGRSHNMFFIESEIYSYGYHYMAAKIFTLADKSKTVLVNSKKYSVSTGQHLSEISSATSHLKQITVPVVNPYINFHHEQNLEFLNDQIADAIGSIFALKGYSDSNDVVVAVGALNAYINTFKLKAKGMVITQDDLNILSEMEKIRNEKSRAKRALKEEKVKAEKAELELAEYFIYTDEQLETLKGDLKGDEEE